MGRTDEVKVVLRTLPFWSEVAVRINLKGGFAKELPSEHLRMTTEAVQEAISNRLNCTWDEFLKMPYEEFMSIPAHDHGIPEDAIQWEEKSRGHGQ